jgi:hypothetical protein
LLCVHKQSTGGVRPNARENRQINPPTTVRAAQCAGGRPHLAAVLQDSWKYANIHADLGVIRGIPASSGTATVTCLVPSHAMTRITPTLAAFALAALAALVEPATAADPARYELVRLLHRHPGRLRVGQRGGGVHQRDRRLRGWNSLRYWCYSGVRSALRLMGVS